jgi:hypothetical protein
MCGKTIDGHGGTCIGEPGHGGKCTPAPSDICAKSGHLVTLPGYQFWYVGTTREITYHPICHRCRVQLTATVTIRIETIGQ